MPGQRPSHQLFPVRPKAQAHMGLQSSESHVSSLETGNSVRVTPLVKQTIALTRLGLPITGGSSISQALIMGAASFPE